MLNNTKNNGESRRYPDIETYETAEEVAWMLEDGGYATDSSYAESLLELVQKYDLTRFDYIDSKEKTSDKKNSEKSDHKQTDITLTKTAQQIKTT